MDASHSLGVTFVPANDASRHAESEVCATPCATASAESKRCSIVDKPSIGGVGCDQFAYGTCLIQGVDMRVDVHRQFRVAMASKRLRQFWPNSRLSKV